LTENFLTKNKFILYIFYSFLIVPFLGNQSISYAEGTEKKYNEDVKFENKIDTINKKIFLSESNPTYKSTYILGSGDTIKIDFYALQNLSNVYLIDNEGYLTLPEIDRISAKNLTVLELKNKLEKAYSKYIKKPDISINIFKKRPITIFLGGEVKIPGLYEYDPNKDLITLAPSMQSAPSIESTGSQTISTFKSFKLYYALKLAEGFTNYADLSNIKVVRKNSISQGGGKISTKLNFLKLFTEGDQTSNIELYDGDYIYVGKSENVIKEQLQAINKTNISPDIMTVYITGNVPKTGEIKLKTGASLLQAIASAGGKKIWTGDIEFLSFNPDGSSTKRIFRYDSNAKINSYKNPTLNDGDVINVRKTIFGSTTEVLKEIKNPILSGYGLIKLFGD